MFRFRTKNQATPRAARFSVPLSDPFENPLVETNPVQLRQWAASLPYANPEQLCEALINSLGRLNRFPGQVKRREELMQVYHTPSARLLRPGSNNSATLSLKLLRQLVLELAYGHLHLTNELLCEHINAKNRMRLHTHLLFASKFLSLEHLYACEAYDCRSNGTLRELIRLYTLAEEQQLQDTIADQKQDTTISHQAKSSLLLMLLDPCHLQEGESRTVFNYLSQYADMACFETLTNPDDPTGYYVVDRLGDVSPHPYNGVGNASLSAPRFHLFNLNPVSQQLHRDLRLIEQQNKHRPQGLEHLSSKAAISLLRRMLKSWHIRPKRGGERHKTSGQVTLWLGLDPIHQSLSDDAEDISMVGDVSMLIETSDEPDTQTSTLCKLDCWRFNQSRSGVALHLPLPLKVSPQVGEIVMLTNPDESNPGERKVGIIRRALIRESLLEIGVQFINDRLTPITLQPVNAEDDAPILPALYLGMGDIERSSLIITRDSVEMGQHYRVDEMIPAPTISPVHLLEVTDMFERYRVKRV